MTREIKKITDLKLDDRNHNLGTLKGNELLDKSIEVNKFGRSIVVSKDGKIIAGNKTVEAAIRHGEQEIIVVQTTGDQLVVVQRTDIEDNSKEFYNLAAADNLTQAANFDLDTEVYSMLVEEYELEEWLIEEEDVDEVEAKEKTGKDNEDDVPEEQEEAITVLGDVYEFTIAGDVHRLCCGDSMIADDLDKLMDGKLADIVFTDPPYDLPNQEYAEMIYAYCDDAHIFVMHDDRGIVEYLRKSELNFKQFFVCTIGFSSPRGNDPYLGHIMVSHESKGEAMKHNNMHDGFSSVIKIEYRFRLKDEKTGHKHQKPVALTNKFIVHYSLEGHNVLDLFGGSGTTAISAIQTRRNSYTMELSPNWCDVIVKRIVNYCDENQVPMSYTLNGEKQ